MDPKENHTVTFVTALMKLYDAPYDEKTILWRFDRFREIAETGIRLCVYVSEDMHEDVLNFAAEYENIKVAKVLNIENTEVAKMCEGAEYELPHARSQIKDHATYMWMMNSKFEFLNDAAEQNLWKTTHFAWIDFSITYIFKEEKEKKRTLEYLQVLGKRALQTEPFLAIPGCLDKIGDLHWLLNGVAWRFCGGFLLGDPVSIRETHELYRRHFGEFVRTHRRLVWEVNFWAWLETNTEWAPTWYKADHNDSIVKIPVHLYCTLMEPFLLLHLCTFKTPPSGAVMNEQGDADCAFEMRNGVKTAYEYPPIETFQPMQCSYLCFEGKHYLNTRYVNYWYLDSGHCSILHPRNVIITQNMVSELDPDNNYQPKYYEKMREEETIGLSSKECYFYGLEDIRLYEYEGKMRFIATNINYSPIQWNSMVVGEYDAENRGYKNCRVIGSPNAGCCEKNWIPIGHQGEELFIYKWFPMEIGKIVKEKTGEEVAEDVAEDEGQKDVLKIVRTYPITAPNFDRVRGSTTFVDRGDYLVGLVHFSEDLCPRRYYHIMVALCKETLKPMKYSEVFCFQHLGIEFCTGFSILEKTKYMFWISKWDREPKRVLMNRDQIELKYDFYTAEDLKPHPLLC